MPERRRVHATPVPRLGGVAVLLACGFALALGPVLGSTARDSSSASGWDIGALVRGHARHRRDRHRRRHCAVSRPLAKLGLQIVAATIAVAGGYGLRGMTNPFTGGFVAFGALGPLVTVAWIVAITNAFNLIDGLDGLATGVALIASATLLAISLSEGRADAACLWATLAGALVGFLRYNFNPASIFLGDSGSLLLGLSSSRCCPSSRSRRAPRRWSSSRRCSHSGSRSWKWC